MPSLINSDYSGDVFNRDDWKERIAAWAPAGPDVFSLDQSEAVLEGDIPWDVRYSFILAVLGYSTTAGNQLVRHIPLFHPWYPYLVAQSVSLAPYAVDNSGTEGSFSGLKRLAEDINRQFDYTGWQYCRATIRFKQQPYEILDDSEIDNYYGGSLAEYQRYCYDVDREGSLEVISQTGRLLKFAEGAPKAVNAEFPSEIGTLAYKDVINYKWMYVPKEYVCGVANPDNLAFLKIDPCVGKLNATEFLGYPRGTLLLNPPKVERFLWPLRTTDESASAFGYHITFPFQHFDPPSGVSPQVYYGHNNLPWGGRIDAATSATCTGSGVGKFYYATTDGTTSGSCATPLLEYAEFKNMFQHADATSPP